MRLKYNFVVQQVDEDFVAVAVGEDAAEFGGLIRMNKTGAFLFEQLKSDKSRKELLTSMVEKYDAPEAVLAGNLDGFLERLEKEGVLV